MAKQFNPNRLVLALIAAFAFPATVPAANVIWVTNNTSNATPWVNFLATNGFNVDVRTDFSGTLSAAQINTLNGADLIIMARASDSGQFAANAANITQWAGITTPIIVGNAFTARANRWAMVDADGTSNHSSFGTTTLGNTSHPIFNGVTPLGTGFNGEPTYRWSEGTMSWVNATAVTGDGQLLGVRNNAGSPWVSMANWGTGSVMGANTVAERRFYFPLPLNFSDLNPTGQEMLLNLSVFLAPEPGRAVLFSIGLLVLVSRRRR